MFDDRDKRIAELEAEVKRLKELYEPSQMSLVSSTPKSEVRNQAKRVIEFLNVKAGKAFRPTEANIEPIVARIKEGYTIQDLKTVTVRKCREWASDEFMAQYLRPATLFNRVKFNQYIGECVD